MATNGKGLWRVVSGGSGLDTVICTPLGEDITGSVISADIYIRANEPNILTVSVRCSCDVKAYLGELKQVPDES